MSERLFCFCDLSQLCLGYVFKDYIKEVLFVNSLCVPCYPYQKVSHLHGHCKKLCYEISLGALHTVSLLWNDVLQPPSSVGKRMY